MERIASGRVLRVPLSVVRELCEIFRDFQPVIWGEILEIAAAEGSPQGGGGLDAGGAAALEVVARVADEDRPGGRSAQACEGLEDGLGVRFGVLDLVGADDH